MRIALIAPHFPPDYVGGVELYTRRVADWLLAHDHAPVVICIERIDQDRNRPIEAVVETSRGYEIHRLAINFDTGPDPFRSRYYDRRLEHTFDRFFRERRPDLVHLQSGYLLGGAALEAALGRHLPTVVTLHDFWFICSRVTLLHPNGSCCTGPDSPAKCAWCLETERRRWRVPDNASGGALGRTMIRLLGNATIARVLGWQVAIDGLTRRRDSLLPSLARVDTILAPSRFLRDQMDRAGIPAERITILRYGIAAPPARATFRSDSRMLRIGYLGQVAPHKGVHVLIEAVRRLADRPLDVRVYGQLTREPSYVAELMRLAGDDPRIVFAGPYEQAQLEQVLGNLDVTVVPSVWYENSPFVIHEAHAAGVPVVASRLGGMRELIEDESSGLLFDVGDGRDLAEKLSRLLDDPELLPRLRAGIGPVRTFETEMTDLTTVYERILSGRRVLD